MNRLKSIGMTLKRELKAYQRMLRHRRTPMTAKLLLTLAVGYAFCRSISFPILFL